MKKIMVLLFGGILIVIAALILPSFSEIAIIVATVGAVSFVVGYILICQELRKNEARREK